MDLFERIDSTKSDSFYLKKTNTAVSYVFCTHPSRSVRTRDTVVLNTN